MGTTNRVLILYAHPAPRKSRVNRQLVKAVRELPGVTFRDLYECYPDMEIDVQAEKYLLLEHDIIVFQHPFYWYSTPSILKEWTDLVLEYGFAYGEGGTALRGKVWLQVLTAGANQLAYSPEGHNRFSIREFLRPMEQTAFLCGMTFLPPWVVHGTLHLNPETEIPKAAHEYRELIEVLRDTHISWTSLPQWQYLNSKLQGLRSLEIKK